MSAPDPTASTRTGLLRGTREHGLSVFRAIPFAAPPTAGRRFQPPAPPETWTGVRDATSMGPAPHQIVDPLSQRIGVDAAGAMHEDCLQLNVWTPATDDARRPVLVWLHGGAFATGSGTSSAYSGHRIAARADVVVVTLNYRVGALGFLDLSPHVPSAGGPNLGLLDQIAALEWVRAEIAGFGGDPDQVTVFGESAGAGSIVALLAMPAARGLFARAIVQSPAPDGMLQPDEASDRARLFLDKLGLGPKPDLESLTTMPVERLLEAQQACIAAGPHRTGMFFAPVIDGKSLPTRPLDAIAAGSARDVQLLIGTTEEEMQLYATLPGLGDFPDEILLPVVASRLRGDETTRSAIAERALDVYRADLPSESSQRDLFFALETDLSLRIPATQLAADQSRLQPRTYMYLFQWRSPMSDDQGGQLGACHALDLPFTFGSLDPGSPGLAFATGGDPKLQDPARILSDRIIDAWTAFARTGDPSHPQIGTWQPYDASRRATMLLGDRCGNSDAPLETRRAVWKGSLG